MAKREKQRLHLIKEDGRAPDKFTCDECGSADTCEYAFDWYNTDGDCLDLK